MAVGTAGIVRADVPYPTCEDAGCGDPRDYASYLFLGPDELPNDFNPSAGDAWKFLPETGMDVVGAWRRTTGRPDVVIAVLDSGIRWNVRDLARKVALNRGELPVPSGCPSHDCNGDGLVTVEDFADVPDANGNSLLDGQDLIRFYSDGVDDDANGYVDDIAGWDFYEDDNDPDDDVDYGHGTGEAADEVAEANNGSGFPGVAPSATFLPLRVADSFVAVDADFAQAVVYAVDWGVSVISEALGTLNATPTGQAAIDYAYRHGIAVVASAADEESRHHNFPANYEHTIWVNSVRNGDGTFVEETDDYTLLNGCTNYGGRAWVAIPSSSCSSEATSRAGGLVALLVAHGKNQIERGLLEPYPGLSVPFSAEEVRQILRLAARDVDHSADLRLTTNPLVSTLLSAIELGLGFGSSRFPTQPGWDPFTGYGRPDAVRMFEVVDGGIPPEADLSGNVRWFDTFDPVQRPGVDVIGSARAVRTGNRFGWELEVGCGVAPVAFERIAGGDASGPLERVRLGTWRPGATAAACGFEPGAVIQDPDAHTVTLRLRVVDVRGNAGEDRRTVAIHHDSTLRFRRALGSSGEGSPALADVDRDGTLDIVYGASDGRVHVVDGRTGKTLPGFPAETDPIPVHPSPAYASGEVPVPREPIVAPTAADDLDGDGRVEIVVATTEGRVTAFDDHGRRRPGFPVATDATLSDPANRNRLNDTDPGILAAPTLADLDAPGVDPRLEIVAAAFDGHVYAWHDDGSPVAGFPVRLADPARVEVDPVTGFATPRAGVDAKERAAKIVGSPAVGDLDGDGRPEIVVPTSEEYGGEPDGFAVESRLFAVLQQFAEMGLGLGDLALDVAGRVYALHADGSLHAEGPFRPGWPASVPLLVSGLLPTVATGTPAAPALADVDASGRLSVAVSGSVGPVMLFDPGGAPVLGTTGGTPRALAIDFPAGGFPSVPEPAGSADAPFFGALGSGAFGDVTGDGRPEYVAATGGLRKLIDVATPANQGFGDHQVSAWDPRTGAVLPAFPARMDDLQFLTSPALADTDGDGVAEVVQGSGAYLLRAYRADGGEPSGWPKFTHGWLIATPAAGDVDGDGLIEIVAVTREGSLFEWDTPAPASESALPWPSFGRDRRNTQNLSSEVSSTSRTRAPLDGLAWALEAIALDFEALLASAPPDAAQALRSSPAANAVRAARLALERDQMRRVIGLLPRLERSLRRPPKVEPLLEPLHGRLVEAARAALARTLSAVECDGARADCEARVRRARALARAGALFHALSRDRAAVSAWTRALATLLALRRGA